MPPLPPNPNLEQLKNQAKDLLKAHRSADPRAAIRLRQSLSDLSGLSDAELFQSRFALKDAQRVIAREYGFSSWQKLADEVGQPAVEEQPQNSYLVQHDRMARDLIAALRTGREEAFGQRNTPVWQRLRQKCPRFAEASREEILSAELSLEEAREVVAREEGHQSWAQLVESLSALAPGLTNKDQLRSVERLHDEFARLLTVNFTFAEGVDRRVDVHRAFVDQTSYGEFVASYIASPGRAFRLQVDGLDGDVVLDIAMPVVQGLVAAGGDQGNERARLEYFAERIARDLEKAWAPFHPIAVRSFELYTDPAALELAPAHEIVLELAFEAKARPAETGWCGRVSLCYPRPALVALMPQLAEYWPEESAAGG